MTHRMAFLVLEFSKIVFHCLPGDMGEGVRRISDKQCMEEGGLKRAFFAVTSFLNDS